MTSLQSDRTIWVAIDTEDEDEDRERLLGHTDGSDDSDGSHSDREPTSRMRRRLGAFALFSSTAAIALIIGGSQRATGAVSSAVGRTTTALRTPAKENPSSLVLMKDDSATNGTDDPFCGSMEDDTEFVGIPEIRFVPNVANAGLCCLLCQQDPSCRAWTWYPDPKPEQRPQAHCSLKTFQPEQVLSRSRRPSFVSGQPYRRPVQDSLFCWTVARGSSYELPLLAYAHKMRTNLFGCDEYAVYSNESFEVVPGVRSVVVNTSLSCKSGGEFKTALNTDIFLTVWSKVIEEGRFRYNDWTVKTDPDSVFFATRLRVAVSFHRDSALTPRGVYLNNCKYGLHGPLEVLSKQAVLTWAAGSSKCLTHFEALCSGPCLWGEDMFLDQCFQRVLMVDRVNDWNLLSEAHCDSKDWKECDNGAIAFHPFKTVSGYRDCLRNANYGALPKPES